MWIYPANAQQKVSTAPPSSAKAPLENTQKPQNATTIGRRTKCYHRLSKGSLHMIHNKRKIRLLAICYLAGILLASLFTVNLQGKGAAFIHHYLTFVMDVRRSGDALLIFSTEFLSSILLFTLVLLAGLCAFGVPLIYIFLLLRGCGTGLFVSTLYAELRLHGILINLLLFLLPETLLSALSIMFCAMARDSSRHLAGICFRHHTDQKGVPQELTFRYLVYSIMAMIPCGLAAILAHLFSSVI